MSQGKDHSGGKSGKARGADQSSGGMLPRELEATLKAAAQARSRGRPAEAKRLCEAVFAQAPDNITAPHLYGVLAFEAGQPDAASAIMARALSLAPNSASLHSDAGKMLAASGKKREARAAYRRAIELDPNQAGAWHQLALLDSAAGRTGEAIGHFCKAFGLTPEDAPLRHNFSVSMRGVSPASAPPNFEAVVRRCFGHDDIDHQNLAHAAIALLKQRQTFPALHDAARNAGDAWIESAAHRRALDAFMDDALLHALLGKALVVDLELEKVLVWVRRLILVDRSATLMNGPTGLRFAAFLGLQCFHNGFVYAVTSAESAAIDTLIAALAGRLAKAAAPTSCLSELLTVALYRPLHRLAFADSIAKVPPGAWGEPAAALLTRSLLEPREEAALRGRIPSLGEISDKTSRAVQAQYEENPFPPWIAIAEADRMSLGAHLREVLPGFVPPDALSGPVDVLIAGCGTGKHPLEISRLRETREIVAVDLSQASLAYALRMARKLGVTGVRFMQGDILDLGKLERKFDLIECVGVLHHMASPMAGWRALLQMLRQGGVMRIGLYSARARGAVVKARERAQALGLSPTPGDIRELRSRIVAGEEPGLEGTTVFADFFNLSACRDLMFHACEHRFTPLRIAEMLAELGLEFLGFELSPALARAYRARVPNDPRMTDLARWDAFEAEMPGSFIGMFVFWCRRAPD